MKTSGVNSITIPNLNVELYDEVKLKGNLYVDAASSDTYLLIRFNGETGAHYSTLISYDAISNLSPVAPANSINDNGNTGINLCRTNQASPNDISFEAKINRQINSGRTRVSALSDVYYNGNYWMRIPILGWYDGTSAITSITLIATNSKTFKGVVTLEEG